jgi:sensor histidine kinase YesM
MEEERHNGDDEKNLTSEVRLYIEKRIELFTLTFVDQISLIAAQSVQKVIGFLLLAGAVFFLWFALGFLIGDWIDNTGLGFLIVSVPLFIASFVFVRQKSNKLTDSIQSELIKNTLESVNIDLGLQLTEKKNGENQTEE